MNFVPNRVLSQHFNCEDRKKPAINVTGTLEIFLPTSSKSWEAFCLRFPLPVHVFSLTLKFLPSIPFAGGDFTGFTGQMVDVLDAEVVKFIKIRPV